MTTTGKCIKGDCENGQGTMVTSEGYRYEGDFQKSSPHGQGILIFPDGKRYEGEFENGVPHGTGTVYLPDGGQYTGEMHQGNPFGRRCDAVCRWQKIRRGICKRYTKWSWNNDLPGRLSM